MTKVRLLFTEDSAGLGEKIALALEAQNIKLAFGLFDEGDLDPEPIVATLVIWSRGAARDHDIVEAAVAAMQRQRFVPVSLTAAPPRGFESVPPISLAGWSGDVADPRWRFVLDEIALAERRASAHELVGADGAAMPAKAADLGGGAVKTRRPPAAATARALSRSWPPRARAAPGAPDATVPPATSKTHAPDAPEPRSPDPRASSGAATPVADSETTDDADERKPGPALIAGAVGFAAALAVMAGGAYFAGLAERGLRQEADAPGPDTAGARLIDSPLPERGLRIAEAGAPALAPPPGIAAPETAELEIAEVGPTVAEAASADAPSRPVIAFVTPLETETAGPPPLLAPFPAPPASQRVAPAEAQSTDETVAEKAAADQPDPDETATDDPIARLALAVTAPAETPTGGARRTFRDCPECPVMADVPAGAFVMGSPPEESARSAAEGPQARIVFAEGFAIGAHEITFVEWDACVADGGCRDHRPHDMNWGRGRRPVVNVSYEDATAYARWLSDKTGETYRLPSEAEWEFAARAGARGPFSFDGALSPQRANYHGDYPYGGAKGVYRRRTTTVGSFAPNAFGLYDVHGNVEEWTADCWAGSHADAPEDGAAVRSGDCAARVVKGGAWNSGGWRLRAAYREAAPADARRFNLGFRVVREDG